MNRSFCSCPTKDQLYLVLSSYRVLYRRWCCSQLCFCSSPCFFQISASCTGSCDMRYRAVSLSVMTAFHFPPQNTYLCGVANQPEGCSCQAIQPKEETSKTNCWHLTTARDCEQYSLEQRKKKKREFAPADLSLCCGKSHQ